MRWLVLAVLLAAAALGVWLAFQRPDFVAGLMAIAAGAAAKAAHQAVTRRKSPEAEASWRQDVRAGIERDARGRERWR